MPLDPYAQKHTVQGILTQKAREAWPVFYNAFNALLALLFEALRAMITTAFNAIQGK